MKKIFPAVSVIILLALLLLPFTPEVGQAAPRSAGTSQLPVLFGAYTSGDLQSTVDELQAMENWLNNNQASGVTFAGDFMSITFNPRWNVKTELNAAWDNGYMPFVNLMPSEPWEGDYGFYDKNCDTAEEIADGSCDDHIRSWANYFKDWAGTSKEAYIAPLPEANGDWPRYRCNGTTFKAAYTRIQTLFQEQGVPDSAVHWVFAPNGWHDPDWAYRAFENYYPGNSQVDIVAFSSYNYGGCPTEWASWDTFSEGYQPYLDRMLNLAPTKPIFIAQMGTVGVPVDAQDQNQNKSAWVRDVFDGLASYPNLRAILYFNKINYNENIGSCQSPDYRIFYNSSGEAGFLDMMQDSRFGKLPLTDPLWDDLDTYLDNAEIDVVGNGNSIPSGDSSPSTADGTAFGAIEPRSTSSSHTFTITNAGNGLLLLDGSPRVKLSGDHPEDFSVTAQPASPVDSEGGSTSFEVVFQPSAGGIHTAEIEIENNDLDEDPYTFTIQGTGLGPEIELQGKGQTIASGDTYPTPVDNTAYGQVSVTGSGEAHTFTIHNQGTEDLNLLGSPAVQVSGDHASDFTITEEPQSTVTSGGSTTFQIRFLPGSQGLRTAQVSIANDDQDENPYTFSIQGEGVFQWEGSVEVTSDQNVVTVSRPHLGEQIMTYTGSAGSSTTQYAPMLFKDIWGYNSALFVQNMNGTSSANLTITYLDDAGNQTCTETDTLAAKGSVEYWLPDLSCLPAGWAGGAVVEADQPITAVGRPHLGSEITSYNGFPSGGTTMYAPMLFKNTWGYDSALYVQNVDSSSTANVTIRYFDDQGAESCSVSTTIAPQASKGWWLPKEDCLPAEWVGGAVITADQPIAVTGRPHLGSEVTTYTGFERGSTSMSVPMLFSKAWNKYNAALYVQNVNESSAADVTIRFQDEAGNETCSINTTLQPLASKGWWLPKVNCLPEGWVGGVKVEADQNVVAVGRLHIGSEVTTYESAASGGAALYSPMMYRDANGGSYDSALYVQNQSSASTANVTVRLLNQEGSTACEVTDSIPASASKGYWLPKLTCDP